MFIKKLGIDLGTTNSLVFVPHKGIVINEPSVISYSVLDNKILAVGIEAKKMLGKVPDTISVYRPLKDGVIADYRITRAMLSYFINKACGKLHLFKPDVMISAPAGITSTEKRAVIEAALQAGAKNAYVVKEPLLAAIGAGIPINESVGSMIVNIGGGTTEVAVISLGGIVSWASIRVGGNKLDSAIADYIRKKYNLVIGDRTAEEIKIKIGSAIFQKDPQIAELRGRDIISGLPKSIEINSNEITQAIEGHLKEIGQTVKGVFSETPPELSADILDRGIIISGGSSMLKNMDKFLEEITGVGVFQAKDPLFCVAKGAGFVLDNLKYFKKSIASKKI